MPSSLLLCVVVLLALLALLLGLAAARAWWKARGAVVRAAEAAEAARATQADLQQQLAAAQRVAQAAHAAHFAQAAQADVLGRLAGSIAHDFNNLLGVVSNSAHLIERFSNGRSELQLPVAATLRAVDSGTQLTRHLARLASRPAEPPQALDLVHTLPELQGLLQTAVGRRVALHIDVTSGTRPVFVVARELELALLHLALNARDALPRGGQLWLQARNAQAVDVPDLPAGAYVLLTVADDGRGADEAPAQQRPGLEPVLAFCSRAAGTARVASTPGLGTTVSLLLPAAPTAAA